MRKLYNNCSQTHKAQHFLGKFLFIKIAFFSALFFGHVKSYSQATAPDLAAIPTVQGKVDAWRDYCNQLLRIDYNFKKVIQEGHKGLALVPDDSVWIKAMFNLFIGAAYENLRQYDSATSYIEKSVLLASKTTDGVRLHLQALTRLNYVYTHTRNNAMRNATVKRITKIADTSKRVVIKVMGIEALEEYYADIGDYEQSLEYGIQWIGYYKQLVKEDSANYDAINIGFEMSNLGERFTRLKQYDKAIEYLNEATAVIGDRALTGNEESLYRNYVGAFLGSGQTDSAKKYYQLIYKGMAGRDTIYHVLCAANYLFGEYYLNKNNIDSALHYTLLARRFGKQAPEQSAYISAGQILGTIYYKKENYAAALALLRESLNNEFEFDRETYANINKTMSDCFAMLRQWDSAYTHVAIYNQINDSLLSAAANTNFANAEAKYQNKEKLLQIASKNNELKAQAAQRRWLTAGLALAALVAILLVIIYRNKKRTADALDEKNKALSLLNAELDQANQTKARLFSIIGHDLRSPISQVYQFLNLQQKSPHLLSDAQKETIGKQIQTATGNLLETMEDLLLWSKTQLAGFTPTKRAVEIGPLVSQTAALLQLHIDSKNVTVHQQIPDGALLDTDPDFLQIIVRNLLQNAVKASPQSAIINIDFYTSNNRPIIAIKNEGAAFTQTQYLQAIHADENNKSLNGLGLRLVDELAGKLGASIQFSNVGENSTLVEIAL